MTVPSYQSFAEAKASTDVLEITVNKPAGVVENDLMVAVIVVGEELTILPFSENWTRIEQIESIASISTLYKVAGASEPADYTFSWGEVQTGQAYGFIMRITDHNISMPINIFSPDDDTSATPTCPTVTTTLNDCLILRIFGADDDDITVDGGYPPDTTGITVDKSSATSGSCSGGAAWKAQANAGATGTAEFSLTASEEWVAITIGIQPPAEDIAVFMGANF